MHVGCLEVMVDFIFHNKFYIPTSHLKNQICFYLKEQSVVYFSKNGKKEKKTLYLIHISNRLIASFGSISLEFLFLSF